MEVIVAIGVIGFVIYQQLIGQTLRGKRVVLLPAVLTVIGVSELRSGGLPMLPVDVACIAISCAAAIVIGLAFGAIMHLESRNGVLWAKMPVKGLWLWLALAASRGVMYVVAAGLHAHAAQAGAPILLTLGLNRLAQAAVVVPRALSAGVPFAPEKDGKAFMGGVMGGSGARPGAFTTRNQQQYPQYTQQYPQQFTDYNGNSYNSYNDHSDNGSGQPGDGIGYQNQRDSGPVDLGTFGTGAPFRSDARQQSEQMPQASASTVLPRTDWRRLAAAAAERLAGNR